MTYFLDTSVIIDLLRKKQDVYSFISAHQEDTMITSSVCAFELYCGIFRTDPKQRPQRQKELTAVLESFSEIGAFTQEEGIIAGELYAALSIKGQQINDMDILIAAAAINRGATLVTKNPKHFARIKSLTVLAL